MEFLQKRRDMVITFLTEGQSGSMAVVDVDIRHRVCRLPYLRCFSYTHARTHSGLAPRTRRDPFRYHTLSSASTTDCLSDCRLLITACVLYFLVVAYLL